MNELLLKRLERAVKRLVKAEINYSWKGSVPDDLSRREITNELTHARKKYKEALALLSESGVLRPSAAE